MKNLFSFIIIASIGITLWWMLSTQRDSLLDSPVTASDGVDAYMNKFTMRAMNEQGLPSLALQAEQLRFKNESDLAELEQPDIRLLSGDNSQWHITADYGRIDEQARKLELESNVSINSINSDEPVRITTESLNIDIDKRVISTDARVSLTSASTHLTSNGMVIEDDGATLRLLAQVRGEHVAD